MNVVDAIAHAMKAEGIDTLFAYPVNPLIEAAAKLDIRTVIVRQERIGLHMADAYSRLSSGDKIGVFVCSMAPEQKTLLGVWLRPTPNPCPFWSFQQVIPADWLTTIRTLIPR